MSIKQNHIKNFKGHGSVHRERLYIYVCVCVSVCACARVCVRVCACARALEWVRERLMVHPHHGRINIYIYIYSNIIYWSNSLKYIVWVKIIHFYFMPKIIRILRSCKFPTVNISKLNYWLVICITKNLIWTTLKMIFSIFRCFCTLRFQIYKYCPNHASMKI